MPDLTTLARWLVLAGLVLAGIGGLIWVFNRLGMPLGRLPGDFQFQSGGFTCFLPLATSILLSLLLTLILNLFARLSK